MYIPGRRRTGSRPSRTVMSLALYEPLSCGFFCSSAIKKACKFRICGQVILYQKPRLAEGTPDRSLHELPELRILDHGGDLGGPFRPFQTSGRRPRWGRRWWFEARLGQRPRDELEGRPRGESRADLACAVTELERPHGVLRVDDQRAVTLESRGLGVAGDLRAN